MRSPALVPAPDATRPLGHETEECMVGVVSFEPTVPLWAVDSGPSSGCADCEWLAMTAPSPDRVRRCDRCVALDAARRERGHAEIARELAPAPPIEPEVAEPPMPEPLPEPLLEPLPELFEPTRAAYPADVATARVVRLPHTPPSIEDRHVRPAEREEPAPARFALEPEQLQLLVSSLILAVFVGALTTAAALAWLLLS